MYRTDTNRDGVPLLSRPKMSMLRRIASVVFIASPLLVSASSFAQKITLSRTNQPLKSTFKELKGQSGYHFFYTGDLMKNARPVNINVKDEDLRSVLQKIFANQPFDYEIKAKTVVLKQRSGPLVQRQTTKSNNVIDVRGRVTDPAGKPLVGATIKVKGSDRTAVTDETGEFQLKAVAQDATIQVSFIGYTGRELTLNGQSTLNIILEIATAELEELNIVRTGYQTLSKERSAGSFAKPDKNILANRTSSMNILQRLDGLIPGLTVNNAAAASQNRFLVRGVTTIGLVDVNGTVTGTNRNPLFVVDGIAMDDVSSINPQDVEDVTVLKDATAASIWGARASNGVIVITTKKGTTEGKLKINYDAFVNFQGRPDLDYLKTLDSKQFIQAAQEVFDPVIYPWATVSAYSYGSEGVAPAPHDMIQYDLYRGLISAEQAKMRLDSLANIDNRKQIKDLWYRNASLMNHSLSFSTGTSKYAVYGSTAYTKTVSNRPGEKNDSYKINIRQDLSVGKYVQLNLITDLSNNVLGTKRNVDINNNYYPYQLFKDANGNNISMPYMWGLIDPTRQDFEKRSRVSLDYNPLDEFNYGYTKNNSLLSRNILGINVKLLDGLRFEGNYGYVKGYGKEENYDDALSYRVRRELVQFTVAPTSTSTPVYYLPNKGGRYGINNINQQYWTVRNQLSYNNSWSEDKHQLNVLLGQEAQEQVQNVNGSLVRGYNEMLQTYGSVDYNRLLTGVPNTIMPTSVSTSVLRNDSFNQSEQRTRFTSYYSNLAYTYARKYSINGSLRVDKSNLFGLDKSAQNRPIWSVGGKWIMTSEEFMKNLSWLDHLAVRATYGLTGNSPAPGTAASYDILTAFNHSLLPDNTGLEIATASNKKMTWESTKTVNLGLDFRLLNNRITGAIDIYRKKTTDLLGYMPTNSFTGYSTILGNLGDLENKGIELSLNTVNVRKDNFRWNTIFNISYNKNTISKLNLGAPVTTARERVRQQYVEGYAAFAVFAYDFVGLDEMGDPRIRLADGTITKTPNVATVNDVQFKGTYQPVWNGGLSNTFGYKSFSLSANAVFNLGHVMRDDINTFYSGRIRHTGIFGFTTGNLHADFADRWKQAGDENHTSIPSYVSSNSVSSTRRDVGYYQYANTNVLNASYIKMRDITLGYSLPTFLTQKLKADQISFRVQLSNIMLWKANNKGIDPEFINAVTGRRSMLMNQSTLSFGVNAKF